MNKEWKLSAAVCGIVLILSACGIFGASPGKAPEADDAAAQPQEQAAPASGAPAESSGGGGTGEPAGGAAGDEPAGGEAGGTDGGASGSDAPAADAQPQPKKAAGEFVGLADANSAEIIVDGEPLPFRFAEGFDSSVLSDLDTGTKLELEYIEQPIPGDDTLIIRLITRVEILE